MVRLLVLNTSRPPVRLGLLRVTLLTRRGTSRRLATVVGVLNLLAGLNELDKGFGDLATVDLLEVLQGAFVVGKDLLCVSNFETNHVGGGRGHLFNGFGKVVSVQLMGSATAADSTGLAPAMRFLGVGITIAERGSTEGRGACGRLVRKS